VKRDITYLQHSSAVQNLRAYSRQVRATEKAGALLCWDRAFMNSVEAFGASSEREADSPIDGKQWKPKQEMEHLE